MVTCPRCRYLTCRQLVNRLVRLRTQAVHKRNIVEDSDTYLVGVFTGGLLLGGHSKPANEGRLKTGQWG
jgi:hypothetical protein